MCNLYRMTQTTAEVAKWFEAEDAATGRNFGAEVYPGYPGAVVAHGRVQVMSWGLPLVLTGKQGQKLKPKPVNNARTDKLATPFWRASFEARRCLIPLSAWAEAEGPTGGKTRSWLSLPEAALFAVAGVWRETEEWGAAYSMVMTDAAGAAAEVHTRMPVLLAPDDYAAWTGGSPSEAMDLCRPWQGQLSLERTGDPWSGAASAQARLL